MIEYLHLSFSEASVLKIGANILLWCSLLYLIIKATRRRKLPPGAKQIPEVSGCLPLVGHGLTFSKDIISFVRAAYKKYGKIFRVKVFRKNLVIVLDHNLKREFFKANENAMSLYGLLESLYFADAFFTDPSVFAFCIKMVKKSVGIRFEEFMPKIVSEAKLMTERLRLKNNQRVQVVSEMVRFVCRTSARCFIGIDMSDEFYENLLQFTQTINKLVVLTYFLPVRLIKFLFNSKVVKYRQKMVDLLVDEIQKYRDDPTKNDSILYRRAVDYVDDETGEQMSNRLIGELSVCLLYVSSENTALGLSNTMIDLSHNPDYWAAVKEESQKFLDANDFNGLISSRILNACLMESARMDSHIFPLSRKPMNENIIGSEKYFIGDCDAVALCEPFMQKFDCAKNLFQNSEKYYPHRYFEPMNEKDTSDCVMTWGHGVHQCPGKQFAILEIKTAMALLTTNFQRFEIPKNLHVGYFSHAAFAERDSTITLKVLNKDEKYEVEYINPGGWLIRNCLSLREQKDFYRYTVNLSKDSSEQKEYRSLAKNKLHPLTYYRLVYTSGSSNCEYPQTWIQWSADLWNYLLSNPKYKFTGSADYTFNSIYAQLYTKETEMKTHKDQFVTWGVSVSLGASCDFQFGDQVVTLNSGDVLVADFSKIDHSVFNVDPTSTPHWFQDGFKENADEEPINTFGRHRCSIQIRYVPEVIEGVSMNIKQFKEMLGGNS
ncbi:hypothetical protein B4U79_16637 [Dinothrombium tinctorium]|uniref:Lanosterol 14-alpha demethylase n=1 Tax=Dinothrombium tinctorium TaxID=1965070 RepID=A0A3S3NMA3_9ACAR|nr:hypothetical protein B4U79_16761 [Dinothrombium tinctorium]RWS01491.1 hypothetical protein B4U79_16724 [Dinothrombium tinctorium]RWS02255.1 hypothetical protein B4U79_16637 [Dinothrombium tinctorium]